MVSITSKKTDSPVVKVEETKPNVKQTPTLTGRQLLTRYINNEYESEIAYRKVCNALEILDRMDPQGRAQFIEQLVDTSDLMDSKCGVLVSNLVNIPWSCIPEESFEKFQKLVGEIAVRHVCHTDTIYNAVVNNLLPKIAEENGENTAALDDKQLHLYTAAHRLLAHIMKCFPMSSKTLMSSLRRHFPHFSKPSPIFNGYIRNLMQIGEYAPHLFADIWDLVFDNAVIADAHLAQREGCFDTTSIFRMENEEKMEEEESTKKDEGYTRLDMFNADVFSYLAMKHGHVPISTLNLIRLGSHVSSEDIFQCFLSILENRLLMSANVRYTSFVFLYLTSLNQSYPQRLIEFLWGIVSRPQRTQADTKKAHGAANYLAAFIARAKGIKLESAFVWLKVIFNWLVQYVDNVSSLTTYAGGLRHGLFYALCQAFFIIFSFRYKDLVKSGDMEDVRRWGLGRIVHCSLEPLKYVSRPVGLCFGAISRSLQLVYVNHVLRNDPSSSKPFEAAFPLDCYGLHTSEHLIGPLMRKFSPLAEDVSHLTSVLQDVSRVEEAPDSGMDFLDEEDLLVEVGGQQIPSSQLFTVYSSSPGLRHFESVIH